MAAPLCLELRNVELDFTHVECHIHPVHPLSAGLLILSALRTFPVHFKKACCTSHSLLCDHCPAAECCPYQLIFNQELSSNPHIVKRHQKPSLPFSFQVSHGGAAESSCAVSLLIIGTALNHLSLLYTVLRTLIHTALTTAGVNGFSVEGYSVDYQGNRHRLTLLENSTESVVLLSASHVLQDILHGDTLTITLKTPLRLLQNGSTVRRFDFAPFFLSMLRRCSSLIAYYGSGELDVDFTSLSTAAQRVTWYDSTVQFTSSHRSQSVSSSGLLGTVDCTDLVDSLLSILRLGSYFNVGKGATYGSGHFSFEVH